MSIIQSKNTPPMPHRLGDLSRKYEVGQRGPEAVSSGKGDAGGVSYGLYQLASKMNRPAEFLAAEGGRWRARFGAAVQGTPEFSAIWKEIARADPHSFADAQHAFIKRTHYAVQLAQVQRAAGVDLSARCAAVLDMVWSCAVQHGPKSRLIAGVIAALGKGPGDAGFDRALIDATYAERGRRDADGRLVWFRRNSMAVQKGVAARFVAEHKDALAMLAG